MTRLYAIRCVATGHICYLLEDEDDARARVEALYRNSDSGWAEGDLFIREVYVDPKSTPAKEVNA